MFTKEYVREVLEQMCSPYMEVTEEFTERIYDAFVKIRNDEAAQPAGDGVCNCVNQLWDASCIGLRCQVCKTTITRR